MNHAGKVPSIEIMTNNQNNYPKNYHKYIGAHMKAAHGILKAKILVISVHHSFRSGKYILEID